MYQALPPEIIDKIISIVTDGLRVDSPTRTLYLSQFSRVCRLWNAVAIRQLYSIIKTHSHERYMNQMLCESLKMNPALCDAIKELEIRGYGEDGKYMYNEDGVNTCEELLRLCSSVATRRILLKGRAPLKPANTLHALSGRRVKELIICCYENRTGQSLFKSPMEVVRFLLSLPDVESVTFDEQPPPDRGIRGVVSWNEEGDANEGSGALLLPSLPPTSTTLPLVKIDIAAQTVLTEECLEVFATLSFPLLRHFEISFYGSNKAEHIVLECLRGFPKELKALQLRRLGGDVNFTKLGNSFVEALDRFTSLMELHISKTLNVDLVYIFSRPTLVDVTYQNCVLTDDDVQFFTSKLEEMTSSPDSQKRTYMYLPLLAELTVYRVEPGLGATDEHFRRFVAICRTRRIKLQEMYCDLDQEIWHHKIVSL